MNMKKKEIIATRGVATPTIGFTYIPLDWQASLRRLIRKKYQIQGVYILRKSMKNWVMY